ncbi:MAG TPA: TRAP transporter substrate-binding protein, partial [Stellaceae bacterium]|nr:TRAP transporter substrate-binding protein [Stellaceae bacterium]
MSVVRISAALLCLLLMDAGPSRPEGKSLTIHAGKADSPYRQLARQFAEAVAIGSNGAFTIDIQESQGSVENIIAAAKSGSADIFTAPPDLIAQARRGEKPFGRDRRYGEIRALFPLPSLTM